MNTIILQNQKTGEECVKAIDFLPRHRDIVVLEGNQFRVVEVQHDLDYSKTLVSVVPILDPIFKEDRRGA